MTELEQLIMQKKELEQKIKILKTSERTFNSVRFSRRENRGGFYNVQTLVKTLSDYDSGERWMVTIRERTKEEIAHRIRVVISDMSELLKTIEDEGKQNEEA